MHGELLVAQLIGGAAVTAVAVVPIVIFGVPTGVRLAELLLIAFIGIVGFLAARTVPMGTARATSFVIGVVFVALVVLWVKTLVHH